MSNDTQAPRILLYSHDSFGLGHYRRSITLAGRITSSHAGASVLCLTGSPRPDLFPLPPRFDYVKLPSVTKDADGHYVTRDLPSGLDATVRLRTELIRSAANSFRPHLVLVDHTPTGLNGELLPMLEELKRDHPETRVVLGMRDIIDAPVAARAELVRNGSLKALRTLYDAIFVYGDREVLDVAAEYEFPADVAAKLSYVGFVCSLAADSPGAACPLAQATLAALSGACPLPQAPPCGGTDQAEPVAATAPHMQPADGGASAPLHLRHVIVSAGGGQDGFALLRGALDALQHPSLAGRVRATLVTGPLMSSQDRQSLAMRANGQPHLVIEETSKAMSRLLADADLVLAMGGYNSVYESLCLGKRLLVMPRVHPRQEQLERATRLQQRGLLGVLDEAEVADPGRLAGRITAALERPGRAAHHSGLRFDGGDRAAERVLALIEGVGVH